MYTATPTISFQNPGLIPLECITTFGLSAKDTANPIGQFGTGLKYAISIILRNGGSFTLYRGLTPHKFSLEQKQIRNQDITSIKMDSVELPFTTNLGKQWDMPLAFRELYSNNLDEGGFAQAGTIPPSPETTTISVTHQDFLTAFQERDTMFLPPCHLVYDQTSAVQCYLGETPTTFYKSIAIHTAALPYLYTYNITSPITLTEDRTVRYSSEITDAIWAHCITSTNATYIHKVLTASDSYQEGCMYIPSSLPNHVSTTFLQTLHSLSYKQIHNYYLRQLKEALLKGAQFSPVPITLSPVETIQLQRALTFLTQCNLITPDKYPHVCTSDLPCHILGLAKEGQIYLNKTAFRQGTKMLAGTYLEEYLHLETGYADLTRELQNILIDTIITLGEQLQGEPI